MKGQETLTRDQVAEVFREPSILTGYRLPDQPLMYYIKSLFKIHNETFNVWSHLVGCWIVIFKLFDYWYKFSIYNDNVLTTLLVVAIASFIQLFASASAHLLHSKSPHIHFVVYFCDYIGVSFGGFASSIYGYYGLSDPSLYKKMEGYYLLILTIVTYANFLVLCVCKLVLGHRPNTKNKQLVAVVACIIPALYAQLPIVPRLLICWADPTCSIVSLLNYVVVLFLFGVAGILFAAHQPEKTWPRQFDILGQGHQLFHMLIVVLVLKQLDDIHAFHKRALSAHSKPNLKGLLGLMVCLFSLEILTVLYLRRYIPVESKEGISKGN